MADSDTPSPMGHQTGMKGETPTTGNAADPTSEEGFQFDSYNKLLVEAATPDRRNYAARDGRKATLFAFSPLDLQTAVIAEAQNADHAPQALISPRSRQPQTVLPVDTQRLINPQYNRQRARSKSTGAAPVYALLSASVKAVWLPSLFSN
jgi:hypothetical protein